MTKPTESLQQVIDRHPDLVEHLRNDVTAPHFSRQGTKAAAFIPPAFSNWRDEQTAWAQTAALFHQSHHMPEMFLDGPDALKLIERLGINRFDNFTTDRAKQVVVTNAQGQTIGDCIAYRHGEHSFELVSGMPLQNWFEWNAITGDYDVEITRDAPSNINTSGRRVKYRFELDGPAAGEIFAAAIDGQMPEIGFFRVAQVTIKGSPVTVLRHGMAGHKGVEISGPFEDESLVRDAILAAGESFGIRPVGTTAYFSTPMSNGWMAYPIPAIFTDPSLRPYREWVAGDGWEARSEIGGSYVSSNVEDYYTTPYDLGYGHIVNFDHDFIGRDALRALPDERKRHKVAIVWNPEDVTRIYASQFGSGPRYKSIDFPMSYYSWIQADEVHNASGKFVGVSSHCGYINPDGAALSLAMLDAEHAVPGTEVVVTWGEPNGGTRKPQVERHEQTTIRGVVAPPPPLNKTVREAFRDGVGAR